MVIWSCTSVLFLGLVTGFFSRLWGCGAVQFPDRKKNSSPLLKWSKDLLRYCLISKLGQLVGGQWGEDLQFLLPAWQNQQVGAVGVYIFGAPLVFTAEKPTSLQRARGLEWGRCLLAPGVNTNTYLPSPPLQFQCCFEVPIHSVPWQFPWQFDCFIKQLVVFWLLPAPNNWQFDGSLKQLVVFWSLPAPKQLVVFWLLPAPCRVHVLWGQNVQSLELLLVLPWFWKLLKTEASGQGLYCHTFLGIVRGEIKERDSQAVVESQVLQETKTVSLIASGVGMLCGMGYVSSSSGLKSAGM